WKFSNISAEALTSVTTVADTWPVSRSSGSSTQFPPASFVPPRKVREVPVQSASLGSCTIAGPKAESVTGLVFGIVSPADRSNRYSASRPSAADSAGASATAGGGDPAVGSSAAGGSALAAPAAAITMLKAASTALVERPIRRIVAHLPIPQCRLRLNVSGNYVIWPAPFPQVFVKIRLPQRLQTAAPLPRAAQAPQHPRPGPRAHRSWNPPLRRESTSTRLAIAGVDSTVTGRLDRSIRPIHAGNVSANPLWCLLSRQPVRRLTCRTTTERLP